MKRESQNYLNNKEKKKITVKHVKTNVYVQKEKVNQPYKCQACIVYGSPISTNDEEINQHTKYHLKISLNKSVKYIYKGFDDYGNRIEETNSENS